MSKFATATDVRTFATDNGFEVKARGALPKPVIAAFNKANPRRKFVGKREPILTLTAKPAKGRTKTRKATAAEVRAFAVEHGLAKAGRGRLSDEAKRAFVLGVETD